jgi:DNA polymerase phi
MLALFWELAKPDSETRQTAAETLLKTLTKEQKTYKVTDEQIKDIKLEEDELKIQDVKLSTQLCPSLSYTLKRLVRGLASSRAGARQGFSMALTEVNK